MTSSKASPVQAADPVGRRVAALLAEMTLDEKIGQMSQVNGGESYIHDYLAEALRAGRVGSVLNEVDVDTVNELQRIAVEESRLGIPLLIGRDVIHGFRTIFPIPLGQAASWNPELASACAAVAAREAAAAGVNWTFAPMIDIARDPRWGRIAESLGEDPQLASEFGAAMVRGYQGHRDSSGQGAGLSTAGAIAACAKHFAGYGAAESGRDYATANVPENELRNVHLRPFRAAVDAGVATLMTSFSEVDGVPATASEFLLDTVLRGEWGFEGLVVSDWDSIRQLSIHGLTADDRGSAFEAARAGVDMEMHGDAYLCHLAQLIEDGEIALASIDAAVTRILTLKFRLGLFENPYTDPGAFPPPADEEALATAKRAALQSAVLLKNDRRALPLSPETTRTLAVMGPLADAPHDQLGTWIFDGDEGLSITPLEAIRERADGQIDVRYLRAMDTSRSRDMAAFDEAAALAADADAVLLFLGEEAILSGEAHSRADIGLPGAQTELVARVCEAGTPVIAVILAGRPLTLPDIVDRVDAILYAWHPGTMAGPALADLLFGVESPCGKLPATFPRMVGQVPIYYNHKNTGKPPSPETVVHIDDIDPSAPQLSLGMTAFHLDAGYTPLFPFGHGLSYTTFDYENIRTDVEEFAPGGSVTVSADITNTGDRPAVEVAQLYVRDLVGNVTRPVRELKGFRRLRLEPGERSTVSFVLRAEDLAFYGRDMRLRTEPGEFHAWIGGSSATGLQTAFRLVESA
ncbi:glycoside hydrolase family 3 N-terminal domain-containing protein [Lentisalinibacter orientalis]|uniref:glycoside hydrolase family 3 N-terminal domain-containing protein n=1 Tax=Lentisalinibacter orientalis TaxID=2992241 RepID=UPI00386C40D8